VARADFEFQYKKGTSHPETQVLPLLTGYYSITSTMLVTPKIENYGPFGLE